MPGANNSLALLTPANNPATETATPLSAKILEPQTWKQRFLLSLIQYVKLAECCYHGGRARWIAKVNESPPTHPLSSAIRADRKDR